MGVMSQGLGPGVQQRCAADLGPEMTRILCQFDESLRSGFEQQLVEDLLIAQRYRTQVFRHRKHHVEVGYRQEVAAPGLQPVFLVQRLALGAVPVAARIVRYPQSSAVVAFVHVATQLSGPAHLYGSHCPQLLQAQLAGVLLSVLWSVSAEDVGQLNHADHDRPQLRGRWLSVCVSIHGTDNACQVRMSYVQIDRSAFRCRMPEQALDMVQIGTRL